MCINQEVNNRMHLKLAKTQMILHIKMKACFYVIPTESGRCSMYESCLDLLEPNS